MTRSSGHAPRASRLVALAFTAVVTANGASLMTVRAATAAKAPATITGFAFEGEDGDPLVGGRFVNAGDPIQAQRNTTTGIVQFTHALGANFFAVRLRPLNDGAELKPGLYEHAESADERPHGVPGIDVLVGGLSCGAATGRFRVDQADYNDDGTVKAFAARFEQHCDGQPAATFGVVAYNATVPVYVHQLSSTSLKFADSAASTSSSRAVKITNAAFEPLPITSATLTGPNADQFRIVTDGCSGTELESDATCEITVAFAPTAAGTGATASLSIVDAFTSWTGDAPGGESVGLIGGAVGPLATPPPGTPTTTVTAAAGATGTAPPAVPATSEAPASAPSTVAPAPGNDAATTVPAETATTVAGAVSSLAPTTLVATPPVATTTAVSTPGAAQVAGTPTTSLNASTDGRSSRSSRFSIGWLIVTAVIAAGLVALRTRSRRKRIELATDDVEQPAVDGAPDLSDVAVEPVTAADAIAPEPVPAADDIAPEPAGATIDDAAATADHDAPAAVPAAATNMDALVVNLFGKPRIEGRAELPARAIEIAALLAEHRDGLTLDEIIVMLGRGSPTDPTIRKNVTGQLSRARRQLGATGAGEQVLPRVSDDGRYRVVSALATDLEQFHQLLEVANASVGDARRARLDEALSLVNGPLCDAPGYAWVRTSGLAAAVEAEIVDVAHELVELALAKQDRGGAESAVRRGLRAAPTSAILRDDRWRITRCDRPNRRRLPQADTRT